MKQSGINATPNKSNKITFKPIGFFKGATKIISEIVTKRSITGVVDGIFDTIDSFKLDKKPEYTAYVLVNRSLLRTLETLLSEPVIGLDFTEKDFETDPIEEKLNQAFKENVIIITPGFFKNPKSLPLLDEVIPLFKEYLSYFELNENIINNILNRFKSYFAFSLADEWRKHPDKYQPLLSHLETPFNEAEQKELEWFYYRQYLQSLPEKPVFEESFGLSSIYIKLRAYCRMLNEKGFPESEKENEVMLIDRYLQDWVNNNNKEDAIKIISGGPGYGKSSLLKVFAASLAEQNKNVLFIPLHLFDVEDDLSNSISKFLRETGFLKYNPIDNDEELIIIFDGLDELSMQDKTLADTAQKFLNKVSEKIERSNCNKIKLKVVISGRDIIIQKNKTELGGEGKILHLLPYYAEILKGSLKNTFVWGWKLIQKDQRDEWWTVYGKLKGIKYDGLPKELKNPELDEITSLPLLNYLVALSYDKFGFDKNSNLNDIYNKLIYDVHFWNRSDDKISNNIIKRKHLSRIEKEQFRYILEEIAMASWYGNSRTVTIEEIEKRLIDNKYKENFNFFLNDVQKGVISLLIAFYFKQAADNNSKIFEFTHKSFGEYLVATKIVRDSLEICKKVDVYKKTDGEDGYNIKEGLEKWIEIFGPKEIDGDIIKFIRNEIHKYDIDILKNIQQSICYLINYSLKNSLPVESAKISKTTYKEWNLYAVNSESALYIIHSLIADQTSVLSKNIDWQNNTGFYNLLNRIEIIKEYGRSSILSYFNNLNFYNQYLYFKDLSGTNLRNSNLRNSDLRETNLTGANLTGANLIEANLTGANLTEANLTGANLTGANLIEAYLTGANLTKADLTEADLTRANLTEADLTGANLTVAYLVGADLTGADLTGADLTEANLTGANLTEANLTGANLTEADLRVINLTRTNLREANLTGANLINAEISYITLLHAKTLEGAIITQKQYEKFEKELKKIGKNIKDFKFRIRED